MKRSFFIAVAIMLLAACSTKEKDIQISVQDDVVFYASFEQPSDIDTRVYANEDMLLRWTADDRVSIFNKNTYNQEYKFTGQTGANAGGFKKVDNDEFVTGNVISHVVSVYPYQGATSISEDEVVSLTVPAEQAYAENTFGLGANTMVSVSVDNVLQYKNVSGYLMLKLYGKGVSVSSITLKGNNGEKLAGDASVTMPLNEVPSVTMSSNASTEITLTCTTPVQLGATEDNCTQFWFVVPPVTFSKGFTITVYQYIGGSFSKSTSKSIAIERNKLSKMSPIEVEKTIPSGNIVFADVTAKYACVEKFDTNGDGEVSYKEAADVTSLNGLFADWNTVMCFDEIQYFTSVTSTKGVFTGLTNLKSIVIPDFITELGSFQGCTNLGSVTLPTGLTFLPAYCFDGCSSLVSITLPSAIISVPGYCFRGCSMLNEVNIPSEVTSIHQYAFSGCSALTSISIPSKCQYINEYAFQNCTSLLSVTFPESLVSLGNNAFSGCTSLASVTLPSDMTSLPSNCFSYCGRLASIVWSENLQSIGDATFKGCSFKEANYSLTLPASVKTIGSAAFGLLRHLIIPSTSPVSIEEDSFETGYTYLYVPTNLVEMYKVRTNWSNYANRIVPMEDYPVEGQASVAGTVAEAVDLGLSVKWASWNVGASSPEEYGDYIAWGETAPSWDDYYSWINYRWSCESYFYNKPTYILWPSFTRYNYDTSYGVTDNKMEFRDYDYEDDAARANWGGSWRMPTYSEWTELLTNCNRTYTTQNGVNGLMVTSTTTGNSIFLPAGGYRMDGHNLYSDGSSGYYWSSSLYENDPRAAWRFIFGSSYTSTRMDYMDSRYYGISVRPVYEE